MSNNDLELIENLPSSELAPIETELDKDLTFVREKQMDIIKAGHDNLDTLVSVADQSQNPRAYEVLSIYMKTLSELNKDLIAISERKSYEKPEEVKAPVTNNLFVGSTAALAKMLKQIKSDEETND